MFKIFSGGRFTRSQQLYRARRRTFHASLRWFSSLFRGIGVSGNGPLVSRFWGALVLFRMAAISVFWISQLLLARRGKAFFFTCVCLPLAS
jgi:hypothetical protein